jgi:archaellum component FlaC
MADDLQDLYDEYEKNTRPYDYGDVAVKKIEDEYLGVMNAEAERKKEVAALNEKLKRLERKLASIKNIKNPRSPDANLKINARRQLCRGQIEKVKDRLHELSIEGEAANVKIPPPT